MEKRKNGKKSLIAHAKGMTTTTTSQTTVMPRMICLKNLAQMLDCHRRSARRWLDEAGISPLALGSGPKGGIRYLWSEVEPWIEGLKRVK